MANINWQNLTILTIDDEPFMLNLLHRMLSDLGVPLSSIYKASNGADGLDILKRLPTAPDVILCDLSMPVMNGLAFTKELRAITDVKLSSIPVIIVTGHSETNVVQSAVKTGINGYVVKPISADALTKRLVHALG